MILILILILILISQFTIFLDRHTLKGFDHQRHQFGPLVLNSFHLWNLSNSMVPSTDESILRETLFVENHVGQFEVILEIGNGEAVSCNKRSVVVFEKLLEFTQGRGHLFLGSNDLVSENCLSSSDDLVDLQVDELEDSWSEEVLVPSEVLVDFGSLLRGGTIVFCQ